MTIDNDNKPQLHHIGISAPKFAKRYRYRYNDIDMPEDRMPSQFSFGKLFDIKIWIILDWEKNIIFPKRLYSSRARAGPDR